VNQTSGATIDFGVAHPAASDLAALKASAASGTAVSGIGDSAWFSTSGDTGQLQIFRGPYWITASSVFFGAPDDAKQLALDAVAAVKYIALAPGRSSSNSAPGEVARAAVFSPSRADGCPRFRLHNSGNPRSHCPLASGYPGLGRAFR
jgi:hypothetical protein